MSRFAIIFAAAVAAVLWSVALAAVWLPALNMRALDDDRAAAVAFTVLAGTAWILGRLLERLLGRLAQDAELRDRVALHLADSLVATRRAALGRTVPLRVVRAQ
jgi:hypothetical protein